jgi:hypothetical protein
MVRIWRFFAVVDGSYFCIFIGNTCRILGAKILILPHFLTSSLPHFLTSSLPCISATCYLLLREFEPRFASDAGSCSYLAGPFHGLGVRGLSICVALARECGDLCTVGDSVRCSDWVASVVSLTRGIAPPAGLTFFASPKESKQRKASPAGSPSFDDLRSFFWLRCGHARAFATREYLLCS